MRRQNTNGPAGVSVGTRGRVARLMSCCVAHFVRTALHALPALLLCYAVLATGRAAAATCEDAVAVALRGGTVPSAASKPAPAVQMALRFPLLRRAVVHPRAMPG